MPRSSSSPFAKSPVLACLLSLMVGDAAAADRQDRREVRQDARIQQGVNQGSITPAEQARLQQQQQRLDRAEARAESDGRVSAAERQRLERRQDAASRQIHRQKHDAQGR